MNFTERRTFGGQSPPAFAHQVVDIARAMLRSRQRNTRRGAGNCPLCETLQIFDDGLVTEFLIRTLSSENQNLPQSDGKRPHVTFGRIFPLELDHFKKLVKSWPEVRYISFVQKLKPQNILDYFMLIFDIPV